MIELIVGLGNPGKEYLPTRHNAGYWFIQLLAEKYIANWVEKKRLHADITHIRYNERQIVLVKPRTFMNKSGMAVQSCVSYFKVHTQHMLVVHDEIDLPIGTVRLKTGGGHGGHNGLRSIINTIGKDWNRLRIGVGHPGDKDKVLRYVLGTPHESDRQKINQSLQLALDYLPEWIQGNWHTAMQALHQKGHNGA